MRETIGGVSCQLKGKLQGKPIVLIPKLKQDRAIVLVICIGFSLILDGFAQDLGVPDSAGY